MREKYPYPSELDDYFLAKIFGWDRQQIRSHTRQFNQDMLTTHWTVMGIDNQIAVANVPDG